MTITSHQYSDAILNKRIAILGPYPPPLGGVSVHIQRVTHKFRLQGNTATIFNAGSYNNRRTRWWNFIRFLHRTRPQLVYYHTLCYGSFSWLLIVIGSYWYGYKLIIVDHTSRDWYDRSRIFKILFRYTIRSVTQHIIIGTPTYQAYLDNNIPIGKNMTIESAYLPPDVSQKQAILVAYPQELWKFLNNHSPIILVNASHLMLWHGRDLYGIDTSLELIKKLKTQFPKIGLLCALAKRRNETYFEQLQSYIHTNNIASQVFFLEGQQELWPLFEHVNLFIRPTLSDSWSISIEEALSFHVPTIASNVTERAPGTVVYNVNNMQDLEEKVLTIMQQSPCLLNSHLPMQIPVIPQCNAKIDC